SEFEVDFEQELLAEDSRRYDVRIVSAPHAGNDNLHAQQGVFTLTRDHHATLQDAPDLSPLDTLLQRRYASAGFWPGHPTVMRLTLPWSQARRLLTLLSRSGVCSAALFPGYAGVADALWESRLLLSSKELTATRPTSDALRSEPCRPPAPNVPRNKKRAPR